MNYFNYIVLTMKSFLNSRQTQIHSLFVCHFIGFTRHRKQQGVNVSSSMTTATTNAWLLTNKTNWTWMMMKNLLFSNGLVGLLTHINTVHCAYSNTIATIHPSRWTLPTGRCFTLYEPLFTCRLPKCEISKSV